jgi:type II secretory pathway pseudopilin PulG
MPDNRTASSFPILELAIVLVVLGIIASIVGPRMSRGAAAPAAPNHDPVLIGRLKTFRAAIDAYTNEHGGHTPDPDRIVPQLTTYTDWAGRTSPVKTGQHFLGPYLRDIPPLPVGPRKGKTTIGLPTDPATAWTYDPTSGHVRANTPPDERDPAGRPYASY